MEREKDEDEGVSYVHAPLLYINKYKRGEKASFICFFAAFAFINFFFRLLIKIYRKFATSY